MYRYRYRYRFATKLALLSFVLLTVLSCRRTTKPVGPTDPTVDPPPTTIAVEPGLTIRLSHANPKAAKPQRPRLAKAEPLDDAQTARVLARLPKLTTEADDAKEFALRKGSKPPPRTGATVLGAFPPRPKAAGKTPRPKGPLEVLRFAPEGEVPLAPHLSITFNHPMVAVTSIDALAAKDVPVTLSPTPPKGKWRWVGTKTLMFEPEVRMPMATDYTVTVPKGTRSAVGTTLGTATRFSFTTPTPTVVSSYPADEPARRQPVCFLQFDQRIDPEAVLPTIVLESGRKKDRKVRRARPEEVEADPTVRALVDAAEEGRFLAFVPVSPLPYDSPVTVRVGPGTPSAEGEKTTPSAQRWSFTTYGRLEVVDHRCGYDGKCPPGSGFEIDMSNPLDLEAFDRSMVTVEPKVEGLKVEAYGQYLYVYGATKGRRTYSVTLSPEIRDQFGQTLGEQKPLRFRVTEAPRNLFMPGQGLTVLDPAAGGKVSVYSVNHRKLRVRAWRVAPKDWRSHLLAVERVGQDSRDFAPPGTKVIDQVVSVRRDADEMVETTLDLSPGLKDGRGHLILAVEQTTRPKEPWEMQRVLTWVQATELGLQGHLDAERMLVWATALADGAPVADVDVQLLHIGAKARTDARGLASLPLSKGNAQVIVARKGDDVAFLPQSIWWWNPSGTWHKNSIEPWLVWHVFDDRGLYRPGETVNVKGWIRTVDPNKGGDVGGLGGAGSKDLRSVGYVLRDSQGNDVKKGTLSLNAFGAFDTSIELPDTMNLGHGSLILTAKGTTLSGASRIHSVRVEEFRRPEYEVSASLSEGPHQVGGHAVATVEADYYAGGGLANAEVRWEVTSNAGYYQPPGHDQYTFGSQMPWWMFWRGPGDEGDLYKSQGFDARTDAAGEHHLRMDFVSVDPARTMSVTAQATVTDVNRQAWTSTTSTVVHPSSLYVGLRSERQFIKAGQDIEVDALVVDIDGKIVPGAAVRIEAARIEYVQEAGEIVEEVLDPQTCERSSAQDPVRCTMPTKAGGTHRIVAIVVDAEGRPNRTEMILWVAGGQLPGAQGVSQEQILMIPDQEQYEDGQTAKIAVSAPWAPAEGLVTIRRSGLVEERTIHLDETSTTIEVPIADAMTPSVTVQLDLVGAAPRRGVDGKIDDELPRRPALATGSVSLSVPPLRRALTVNAEPERAKIEPGGKTTVAVSVQDAAGKAVAEAEVALIVVDEAVLALSGYSLADPLATFYSWREPGVQDHYLRTHVLLRDTKQLEEQTERSRGRSAGGAKGFGGMPGGGGGGDMAPPPPPAAPEEVMADEGRNFTAVVESSAVATPAQDPSAAASTPIALRTDFSALALFSPSVRTDAEGRAVVPVTLPDNLTRYRVMAVAVAGDRQFGVAESTITARLPLMVRPSAPRFLNFGDQMELPVVLQNQTEDPMTVDVAVRVANAELTAGAGRRVKIPAGDRVEVRFPTKAQSAGTARFQVGASSSTWADAASFELPVWTPATTEAFATYGEIDEGGVVQPVAAPPGVFPQFGGLEITTSSTAVQALTDAVLYLVTYPFECSEQTASRVLAIAVLRDVLSAFEVEGLPSPKKLQAIVERDVERLARMQGDDGGFSFWGSGWRSWPYLSVHVAHALERAKIKGFSVPGGMRKRVLGYLDEIERHFDPRTPDYVRRVIRAYALYVQRLAGTPKPRKAAALVDEVALEDHPLEALAWVLPTLHDSKAHRSVAEKIEHHLGQRVTETAAAAHFVTSYADGAHLVLHSDRRVDALMLEALMDTEPTSDLIPKLVRGLLAHRKAGRWSSTQENAFVLAALDGYFAQYEKATPNFVARAWLGDTFAGEHRYRGRTTERHHIDVPMAWLTDNKGEQDLALTKTGKGRMYYRVGMRYAPRELKLPPYDAGFVVERRYEAIDDDDDVRRDDDGTWRIKAGARVRVRLKMVADGRRYHVALVDPLPAGLEPLNPALATTGALPPDPEDEGRGGFWWWARTWYEHQNLRDERVEAFTSLLWSGVYDYDYVARATTPGRFVVPPSKAEEMYHPETFGRGAGDIVVVE